MNALSAMHADDLEDLQDLFENAPCGYLSAKPDGTIVRSNRVLAEWTGRTGADLQGCRFQDLLNFAGKIFYETHFAPLLRMQGHFDEVALDLIRADGSALPVLVNAKERRNESGEVSFIRVTIFNASDRRRYEAELLKARTLAESSSQKLQELATSLEARVEAGIQDRLRLEEALRQAQKMEAIGQLTGGLAHDFNNLLTGILGSLELLQIRSAQGHSGSALERYIAAARGAAKRAAALTHRLLAFARRQALDPTPTNVNRLIDEMEDLLRRTLESSVQLEIVGASGLWAALVDANQLENALLNLCINARDAMPNGGRLTVETANRWLDERAARERDLPQGQYLSICVTDTGTGMPKNVVERAFDPFFTTKPLGAGTGLGLSMVYGFARQSGGQVRIYSEIGQGTTVCIYLPRYTGEVTAEFVPEASSDIAISEHGESILVVDDEPTIRMLVTEVLGELGYRAIEATDGASAMKVLQSDRRIDLLVTDVGLPGGMNGRQVADAARETRPGLKVLFITGYAENSVIGNGTMGQGMEVLTKPFAMEVLARRIGSLMSDGSRSGS